MPATTNPATTPISKRLRSGTKCVLKFSGRAAACVCVGAAVVVAAAVAAPFVIGCAPVVYCLLKDGEFAMRKAYRENYRETHQTRQDY